MISPSIGRVVLVKNRDITPKSSQPEAALIAFVHSDRLINVGGFNAHGQPFHATSIPLLQDDDVAPESGAYAEWMQFQKGQAVKTEALEAQLGGTLAATASVGDPSPLSAAANPAP